MSTWHCRPGIASIPDITREVLGATTDAVECTGAPLVSARLFPWRLNGRDGPDGHPSALILFHFVFVFAVFVRKTCQECCRSLFVSQSYPACCSWCSDRGSPNVFSSPQGPAFLSFQFQLWFCCTCLSLFYLLHPFASYCVRLC